MLVRYSLYHNNGSYNRICIRQYEKDQEINPLPHRIEHLQLIHPEDISRLEELKIIASMQPLHGPSDMVMADAYWGERTRFAYAPKPQIDQGTQVIFGSDAPVESPHPWLGIHAAVTRRTIDGSPGPEGWHPEGRLTLENTLACFTSAAADAAGKTGLQGRLTPEAWADLIILDQDPFQIEPNELWKVQPLATMINGDWAWRNF